MSIGAGKSGVGLARGRPREGRACKCALSQVCLSRGREYARSVLEEDEMLYKYPYDPDAFPDGEGYTEEPTDVQANVLLRALAHAVATQYASEPDMSAQAIALDYLEANAGSSHPLSRDECERIAAVFKVEV